MMFLDVRVFPKATFLPMKSSEEYKRFAFAYTITIENLSNQAVTLKTRRWEIIDANNAVQYVEGAGVVGETPRLAPGETYSYTSGAVIETKTGTMEGSYGMVTDEGEHFDVPIPLFALVAPSNLH